MKIVWLLYNLISPNIFDGCPPGVTSIDDLMKVTNTGGDLRVTKMFVT